MTRLIDAYDAALFDLDGVIYLGPHAIDGVPESLAKLREGGTRIGFVTNNAARTPAMVAQHLEELGIRADVDDVVNSTQATLRMLAADLPSGARVLAVGTAALREQLAGAGFDPIHTDQEVREEAPIAVVQGYHPEVDWALLERGALALQAGASWYATNPDMTRPTERGILPGCGSQLAVVQACVEVQPRIAGKPFRPLLDETVLRMEARKPIFVGDRIDTDIMGANTVGMDSLFVFTGAHGKQDLLGTGPEGRPTHLAWDVAGLLQAPRSLGVGPGGATCGTQRITVTSRVARLETTPEDLDDELDALWAALHLAWHNGVDVDGILPQLGRLP